MLAICIHNIFVVPQTRIWQRELQNCCGNMSNGGDRDQFRSTNELKLKVRLIFWWRKIETEFQGIS